MKKTLTIIGIIVAIIAAGILVSTLQKGPSPVITYDGSTEISIGKSTLQDLFDGGFTSTTNKLASKKWDKYGLVKNDNLFGNAYIKNTSGNSKAKSECKIFGIWVTFAEDGKSRGQVLINGTDFKGKTIEQTKEAMSGFKLRSETDTSLDYSKGSYFYTFKFKDNTVNTVEIKDDTPTVR